MTQRDIYDSISPIDYRYWDKEIAYYLSENGFTRYKCKVEIALISALYQRSLCPKQALEEIIAACREVTTEDVYTEEKRIGHDIRALVNCIKKRMSPENGRFVHLAATSFDISDTANAVRYRDCLNEVVLPSLYSLHNILKWIATRDADTVQIGRTHGQHAVPLTFGFAIAQYTSRLGTSILKLEQATGELVGKFSGAVGAYNASSLFFDDPQRFEQEVLAELHLSPGECSTQIVQPEPLLRLIFEAVVAAGILADLADDMRHLQRTEISEVGEPFAEDQVGSSTMPQKNNPINFENAKSVWKILVPRVTSALLDQLSEHQRDLTNSASARTYGEIFCYLVSITRRLARTMTKLQVHAPSLERNLAAQGELIASEPLYLLLAAAGHPNAHEAVRRIAQKVRLEGGSLLALAEQDPEIMNFLQKLSTRQQETLRNPTRYTGEAGHVARAVAARWTKEFNS